MGGSVLDTTNIKDGSGKEHVLTNENFWTHIKTNPDGNTGSGHNADEFNQEFKLTLANE